MPMTTSVQLHQVMFEIECPNCVLLHRGQQDLVAFSSNYCSILVIISVLSAMFLIIAKLERL